MGIRQTPLEISGHLIDLRQLTCYFGSSSLGHGEIALDRTLHAFVERQYLCVDGVGQQHTVLLRQPLGNRRQFLVKYLAAALGGLLCRIAHAQQRRDQLVIGSLGDFDNKIAGIGKDNGQRLGLFMA